MPVLVTQLLQRAKRCPVACALKILVLLLFLGALNFAVFFKDSLSFYGYLVFIIAVGYVAILAVATNGNCILKISEDD